MRFTLGARDLRPSLMHEVSSWQAAGDGRMRSRSIGGFSYVKLTPPNSCIISSGRLRIPIQVADETRGMRTDTVTRVWS
jgi:hypothetical protein